MAVQVACVDGELVPLSDARIPVVDDGLLRGDGVFEVLRLYAGLPFARRTHLERMERSARGARLPLDRAGFETDVDALLAAVSPRDGLLRLVATRGGRRILLIEELPRLPEALSLGCVTYAPVRVLDGIKSLSYGANTLATRLARERGFDEALLVSPHGRVLELPTASFFWVADGRVRTPPLSEHILDSITRRIAIDAVGVEQLPLTRAELGWIEEAFAVSSVLEVIAVRRIEERELPLLGALTETVARRVHEQVAAQLSGER